MASVSQDIELLSLPPPGIFDSKQAVIDHIQSHAKKAGYAFSIGKARRRHGRFIYEFVCDRGGRIPSSHVAEEARIRQRTSKKTGCKVSVRVLHNHAAQPASAFYQHRALSVEQKELVATNYTAGIGAKHTKSLIRQQDPEVPITTRDIWNMNAVISREQRNGLCPPEAVVYNSE
ncbi:hypothetical protein PVAG01_06071 [Phlyctema vagabunda]|uniref:FAR1 domain-containing protein n=1 Tax=Phlyctema vagabunda TaxID=108571 RepID=A0ABR4PF24_9HELO